MDAKERAERMIGMKIGEVNVAHLQGEFERHAFDAVKGIKEKYKITWGIVSQRSWFHSFYSSWLITLLWIVDASEKFFPQPGHTNLPFLHGDIHSGLLFPLRWGAYPHEEMEGSYVPVAERTSRWRRQSTKE